MDILDPQALLATEAREWLRSFVLRALEWLGARGEVRVRIVDDAEMSAAHGRFTGIGGTTDVLTFDLADPGRNDRKRLDADILVCHDEALRQGRRRGHASERELLLYVVHGVLHCLGHDDRTEGGAAAMHELEDRVLEGVGVGATYGRGEAAP